LNFGCSKRFNPKSQKKGRGGGRKRLKVKNLKNKKNKRSKHKKIFEILLNWLEFVKTQVLMVGLSQDYTNNNN